MSQGALAEVSKVTVGGISERPEGGFSGAMREVSQEALRAPEGRERVGMAPLRKANNLNSH